MMRKLITTLGVLAAGIVGFTLQVQAAPIDGSQSKVENGCVSPIPNFVGQDCSYDGQGGITKAGDPVFWTGPGEGPNYFNPGEAPPPCSEPNADNPNPPVPCPVNPNTGQTLPITGQDRLAVSGDITITGAGPGASVEGTFVIAGGTRNWSCAQADICNESFSSIEHTIPSKAFDIVSATTNSAGGYDYEIGAYGVPSLLKPCVPYPSDPFNPFLVFPAGPYLCSAGFGPVGDSGFNFANQLFPSVTPSIPFAGSAWQGNGVISGPNFPPFFPSGWFGNNFSDVANPSSGFPIDGNVGISASLDGRPQCVGTVFFFGFDIPIPTTDPDFCAFAGGTFLPERSNVGVATTAVATDYSCEAPEAGPGGVIDDYCGEDPSGSGLGTGATFGYENMLIAISTNAAGGIISMSGFGVQEFLTLPFLALPADSWYGGTFEASGFLAESKNGPDDNDIQIDKKNILPVTIYGAADLDVNSIDFAGLELGPGEFYTGETLGSPVHGNAHIGDKNDDGIDDLVAHFRSEESDLRCGLNQVKLRGTSDGVPFVTAVSVNGIGKACR